MARLQSAVDQGKMHNRYKPHQRATARKIRGPAMPTALMEKCHKKGIRMTSQRQVIVGVIGDSEDHPDVDELYRRAVDEEGR